MTVVRRDLLTESQIVQAAAERLTIVLPDGRHCVLVRWRGRRRRAGRTSQKRTMRVRWHNGNESTLADSELAGIVYPDLEPV